MIVPENLFTYVAPDNLNEFVSFISWFEITINMSEDEIKRRYHIAAKTYLSYQGVDV